MRKNIACTALIVLTMSFSPEIAQSKTNYSLLSDDHEIVAKYEHGGKEYSAISKDCIGYSYGKWQISTKRKDSQKSTFDFFLTYLQERNLKYYNALEEAGGYDSAYIGDEAFKNVWKEVSQEKEFQKIYDSFILETQIKPAYKNFDRTKQLDKITTWGSYNPMVQAALHSTIIQHGVGGAYKILNCVVSMYEPKTPEEFIDALYDYRSKKYSAYKTRYVKEHSDLKLALNTITEKR